MRCCGTVTRPWTCRPTPRSSPAAQPVSRWPSSPAARSSGPCHSRCPRNTLIPRPDSETLIEAALAARPGRGAVGSILDLGTGTGCLLLAALTEYPAAWGVGVDLSPAAAALARRNAAALGLSEPRRHAVRPLGRRLARTASTLVLSNPPYVPAADIAGLMPEVARHEPRRALDGGPDGLDAYRALLRRLPSLLNPGGVAVLELGAGQAAPVVRPGRRLDHKRSAGTWPARSARWSCNGPAAPAE